MMMMMITDEINDEIDRGSIPIVEQRIIILLLRVSTRVGHLLLLQNYDCAKNRTGEYSRTHIYCGS